MRQSLIAAIALIVVSGAVQAKPPTWTILQQVCWSISSTAGQCAVRLAGTFPTRAHCIAANGGQVQTNRSLGDGRQLGARCEMLLEE